MGKRTPIFPAYESESGVKLVDFAGWQMPLQFAGGILAEHRAVRRAVGLFDVSHMGEIEVTGSGAAGLLNRLVTIDTGKLRLGRGRYTMLCNRDGGVIDDCLVFAVAPERYLMIVNASNKDQVLRWMSRHAEGGVVADLSDALCMVALQGPRAVEVLETVSPQGWQDLPRFGIRSEVSVAGITATVARTGYSGEDGFEIMCGAASGRQLWTSLAAATIATGGALCGLGARDSLRFEACLPLHGHELSEKISPLEAGLERFVDLTKDDFVGRGALLEQVAKGIPRRLLGCEMIDPAVPRNGYGVFSRGGEVGFVTSGMKSPTIGTFNALVLVEAGRLELDDEIQIEIHKKLRRGRVVKTPFYTAAARQRD